MFAEFLKKLQDIKIDSDPALPLEKHEAAHLSSLLEKLKTELNNSTFNEKKFGEYFMESLPDSMDWSNRRTVVLYLNHLDQVGIDAADETLPKFSSLSKNYRQILKQILKNKEDCGFKTKIDLGVHAIVDFDDLSKSFAAEFGENKNEFAAACNLHLFLARRKGSIHVTEFLKLRNYFLQWSRAAGKILNIAHPEVTLITDSKDERLKHIVNFVTLTVCRNLKLTHIRTSDIHTIKLLCELYLTTFGQQPASGIQIGSVTVNLLPHEFLHQRVQKLLAHLAAWITTLKVVHREFNVGFVRIMERERANEEAKNFSSVVLRTGLGRPGGIVKTYIGDKGPSQRLTVLDDEIKYTATLPNLGPVSDLSLSDLEYSKVLKEALPLVSRTRTLVSFDAYLKDLQQIKALEDKQQIAYDEAYSLKREEKEIERVGFFEKGKQILKEFDKPLPSAFFNNNAIEALGRNLITKDQALALNPGFLNAIFPLPSDSTHGLLALKEKLITVEEILESKITPEKLKTFLSHNNGLTVLRMGTLYLTDAATLSDGELTERLSDKSLKAAKIKLSHNLLKQAVIFWDHAGFYRLDIPKAYARRRVFLIDFLMKENNVAVGDQEKCFADPSNDFSICIQSTAIKGFAERFCRASSKTVDAAAVKAYPASSHPSLKPSGKYGEWERDGAASVNTAEEKVDVVTSKSL